MVTRFGGALLHMSANVVQERDEPRVGVAAARTSRYHEVAKSSLATSVSARSIARQAAAVAAVRTIVLATLLPMRAPTFTEKR